jgi:hypothetical protein
MIRLRPGERRSTVFSIFKVTSESKRNERAIRNYCKDGKLQTGMMLIFRQMPSCQQECEVSDRILFRVAPERAA